MRIWKMSKDVVVRLTEKQHAQLLRRFDVSKVRKNREGLYTIGVSCLCPQYENCIGCPFEVCGIETVTGCIEALRVAKIYPYVLELYSGSVQWGVRDDKEAREEVNAIRDWLLDFEKVRR